MCNIKDGFKLCTCDNNLPAEDASWILRRSNPNLPLHHRKGRAAIPRYNGDEKELQNLILRNLNTGNSFDFDYTPQENDYVKIKGTNTSQSKWYGYRYQSNQWHIDTSDSLAGWKTQLEDYGEGKIRL